MRETKSATTIQRYWRGWTKKQAFLRIRAAAITIQCYVRGMKARQLKMRLLYEQKALTIQKYWRGYNARKFYVKRTKAIVLLQSCVRRMYARRELKKLKIEARSVNHLKKLNKGMENKIIELQQKFSVESKERKHLSTKVQELELKEKELGVLKGIKPEYEKAKTKIAGLESEMEKLRELVADLTKEKGELKEEIENEREEKSEEITGLKGEIALLRRALEDSKKRNTEAQAQNEAQLQEKLEEQRGQMLSEVNAERSAHQKMVKEFARLEQRFSNLEEELRLEQTDPNRIAMSKSRGIRGENDVDDVVYKEEEAIHKLKIELAETERDRDMLASELERTKNEYKDSMTLPLPSVTVNDSGLIDESALDFLRAEKARLISENEDLLSSNVQLSMLQNIVAEEDKGESLNTEQVMSRLLTKLESTKRENDELNKKLSTESGGSKIAGLFGKDTRNIATSPVTENIHSVVSPVEIQSLQQVNARLKQELDQMKREREKFKRDLVKIQQTKVPDAAQQAIIETTVQFEISRLTQENIDLREKVEQLERQSKEIKTNGVMSPPRTRARQSSGTGGGSLLPPGSAGSRPRSNTIGVKYSEDLTAGKLVMTYAGLFRKQGTQDEVQSPTDEKPRGDSLLKVSRKARGFLEYKPEAENELIARLISEVEPSVLEKEVPGLPAHLMFMAVRFVDNINDERWMQRLLANAINGIRKTVKRGEGNMELQAFWLTNTCRLLYDMKQYSGDKNFQTHNTPEQNNQSLQNFDLTEYRQVLTDVAVHIYQELLKTIQDKISSLVVPGLLEYESIPGVLSLKPLGRGAKSRNQTAKHETEDIITVKDITNKLSAILAVLNAHCVDMSLIKQIFTQINYFICANMLNNMLLRKDMCHWSRGMQIRFNLTQLEEWCRTNQLNSDEILKPLDPIKEATQLLQVNKKSLDDVDSILSVCATLNPLQVQKILTMYTPASEYEPRVPSKVIRAVVAKATKQSPDPSSLMMNIQFTSPVNFPFTPSAVQFEKIELPSVLKLKNVRVI